MTLYQLSRRLTIKNKSKLPTLFFRKNGSVYLYQIYITSAGYDVFISKQCGGKVKDFHYKTYPPTETNIMECALIEWNRRIENDGYVRNLKDYGKKSYYDRCIKNNR